MCDCFSTILYPVLNDVLPEVDSYLTHSCMFYLEMHTFLDIRLLLFGDNVFFCLAGVVMPPPVSFIQELRATVGHVALPTVIIKILVMFVDLQKMTVISRNTAREIQLMYAITFLKISENNILQMLFSVRITYTNLMD